MIEHIYWSAILAVLVVGLLVESCFVDRSKVPPTKRGRA